MKNNPRLRFWVAAILMLVVIAINIYIALQYYYLDSHQLTPFYFWQAGGSK